MNRRWLAFCLALTIAALAGSLFVGTVFVDDLPAQVPVHWNIHGQVDATVPRENALPYFLLAPGVMALMIVLALVLPWLSPRHFEVEPFRKVFDYVMGMVVILFGYIQLVILWASLDDRVSLIRWLLGGLFLFFALIGNVLGKVRRNFWMGVRTPWTLASERVWNQTHRLTACCSWPMVCWHSRPSSPAWIFSGAPEDSPQLCSFPLSIHLCSTSASKNRGSCDTRARGRNLIALGD
jgi:uncharacterized membrane protein